MSNEIYRKYIDIINENSQESVQLDEGIMDSIKAAVPKIMKFLGGDTMKEIATKVKEITGGDYTPSKENAIKVATALGFDKKGQVAEGLAGNWQGKLLQGMHLLGLAAPFVAAGAGARGFGGPGELLSGIGLFLLMATGAFWGGGRGQIGAMGKHGNKGWETDKGDDTN